jgi:TonB family protein
MRVSFLRLSWRWGKSKGVHSEPGLRRQWLARSHYCVCFWGERSIFGSIAVPSTLLLNPRLLCCFVLWDGDFMIFHWQKLQLVWLLLCAGGFPCRAESEAVNQWKREISRLVGLHQRVPPEACGKGGQAKIAFRIDRAGKLVSSDIASGTGLPALDKAALEMVRGAQPFPPAPPEVPEDNFDFVVPIIFAKPESLTSCDVARGEAKLRSVISGVCRGC